MPVYRTTVKLETPYGRPSFHKITDEARVALTESGIHDGICVVSTHHTTCSVITQEDSIDLTYSGLEYLQQDFWDVLERIIPTTRVEGQYRHPGPLLTEFSAEHGESKPETLNTDGHLRSALIGRSESIPVVDGGLDLGLFAHIYFIDFDQTRARGREVSITFVGE